jgi:glutaredoxin
MVTLYTLPTCGICHMIKTKLQEKNIPFKEKNFEEIMNIIHSDRAPALEINNNGEILLYNTLSAIVNWINEQ